MILISLQIGKWTPSPNGQTGNSVVMQGISWMGGASSPPKGRPDKIVLKVATLEERPYVIYRMPDEITGLCQRPSVPCRVSMENNSR